MMMKLRGGFPWQADITRHSIPLMLSFPSPSPPAAPHLLMFSLNHFMVGFTCKVNPFVLFLLNFIRMLLILPCSLLCNPPPLKIWVALCMVISALIYLTLCPPMAAQPNHIAQFLLLLCSTKPFFTIFLFINWGQIENGDSSHFLGFILHFRSYGRS